jgi:hypothetical protein
MDTDGDIREMVQTILLSEEIADPAVIGKKVKSPFEMVTSAMRAVNADVQAAVDQRQVLGNLRNLPPNSTEVSKVGNAMVRVSPCSHHHEEHRADGTVPVSISGSNRDSGSCQLLDEWMGTHATVNFEEDLLNNRVLGTTVRHESFSKQLPGDPAAPRPGVPR